MFFFLSYFLSFFLSFSLSFIIVRLSLACFFFFLSFFPITFYLLVVALPSFLTCLLNQADIQLLCVYCIFMNSVFWFIDVSISIEIIVLVGMATGWCQSGRDVTASGLGEEKIYSVAFPLKPSRCTCPNKQLLLITEQHPSERCLFLLISCLSQRLSCSPIWRARSRVRSTLRTSRPANTYWTC